MNTKDKILNEALKMFSDLGYKSVSIRDIAKKVDIKESSIYYHFKNKQDILDSLLKLYEGHIANLGRVLQEVAKDISPKADINVENVNNYFFEHYFFNPFCNQMMRFIMIEQFHDDKMAKLYHYYLFELPYKYQMDFMSMLGDLGVVPQEKVRQMCNAYYSAITMLSFKYLLNGDLTEEKKTAFINEASEYMKNIFAG